MGCHTWFYKRVEVDFEVMRNFVLETYQKSVERLDKWISNPNDKDYLLMVDAYPEWTIEFVKNWRDTEARKMSLVKNGLCREAVINKYCSFSKGISRYVKGKGIFMECGYHDIFRKYGYPDDMLFSYDETLEYIDYPANDCQVYEGTLERLKEFWDKYPDGMIDFG